MKQVRWVSQAVMYGDRRPYPVMLITLAEDEIGVWARERGLPEDVARLSAHPEVQALIAGEVVNEHYAREFEALYADGA